MEPGQILVGLLYLWIFIALGIYGWRIYRRVMHGESRRDRQARPTGDAGTAPTGTPLRPPSTGVTGPAAVPSPPGGLGGGADPGGRADAGGGATLAELVAGIALPCELIPLVAGEPDPRRAVFVTGSHGAGEVAAAVAGELERLGFSVQALGETEAVATREGSQVRVRVHPDGPMVRTLFPDAPAHNVVAELST